MRLLLALAFLGIIAPHGRAQEQQRKLIDRLLRRNLALQNDAQGKSFVTSGAQVGKQMSVRPFPVGKRELTKSFQSDAVVPTKDFTTRDFHVRDTQLNSAALAWRSNARAQYRTGPAWALGTAPESGKSVTASEFRTRSFTGRGKSQKALSQQDTPLTIEQVRELLNKNK